MTLLIFIFFVFLLAYGYLIDYYRRAWNKAPSFSNLGVPSVKVSVIIPVRNEAVNIRPLVECLLQQDYPSHLYEVVIVDDHSTDETVELVKSYSNIKLISLEDPVYGKKQAITTGIGQSSGELIITTDADCRMGDHWLSTIVAFHVAKEAHFIAAPVKMNTDRSLLSIFQAIDFLTLQGVTGASVFKKLHTMCNGANLAYSRKSFEEVDGFEGISDIPSGDDMLLMYKIFSRYPEKVFYLKSDLAIVNTETEKTWKDFFNQRVRWASKATYYEDKKVTYILWLIYLVNICYGVGFIIALFSIKFAGFYLLFVLAKILIEFPFVNSVATFFKQQRLMKYFIVLQPLHVLYILVSGWLGRFGSYTWKSRKIKNG